MSAKYLKQKQQKQKSSQNGKRVILWVMIAVLAVLLAAALFLWWNLSHTQQPDENQGSEVTQGSDVTQGSEESQGPDETQGSDETQESDASQETDETQPSQDTSSEGNQEETQQESITFEEVEDSYVALGYGLSITDVGKYTGVYMEDGSDEIVSGVLMIVVTNSGEKDIQFAEIALPLSEGEAKFSLSTLPAGQSVVLLEQNRLEWSASEDYSSAVMDNLAVFSEPLSLCEDRLELQILNGAINVTNISGEDITGDIAIYYKNSAADLYYGGITYRVLIEGGIKAGEIKQIVASHFSDTGSQIMFVTIAQ